MLVLALGCDDDSETSGPLLSLPAALDFGPTPAGSERILEIEVTNLASTPISIVRFSGEGLDEERHSFWVKGLPIRLEPGKPALLPIAFRPATAEASPALGRLELETDAVVNGRVYVASVALSGRGARPRTPTPPQLPELGPCPSGWSEGVPEGDVPTCSLASSPVDWVCPQGWTSEGEDGAGACRPGTVGGPVTWSCPDGWQQGPKPYQACLAYPPEGPARCLPGHAHFPGERGCRPVGAPCPEGDFRSDLPSDGTVVYVLAGAVNGDGTREMPFGTLNEVNVTRLPAGSVVALSKGTHEWAGVLRRNITFRGACSEQTVLRSPSVLPSRRGFGLVTVEGANTGVLLSDLTLSSASLGGAWAEDEARLELRGVVVDGATTIAVGAANRAQLILEDVLIARTRPRVDGRFGRGVNLGGGSTARFKQVVLSQNREVGIFIQEAGTALVLESVAVLETLPLFNDTFASALNVQEGSAVSGRMFVSWRNQGEAIFTRGGVVELEDVVISHTLGSGGPDTFGVAVELVNGARVDLRRAALVRNRVGLLAEGRATLSLEDVAVSDTQPFRGAGVRGVAISVSGNDTSASIRDSVFGGPGEGVRVLDGATADLERVVFEANEASAIRVEANGAVLRAKDLIVRDTVRGGDGEFGYGLLVNPAGRAEVRGALFERIQSHGLYVGGEDATLLAEDVIAREILPLATSSGRGLTAQLRGSAMVRRSVFGPSAETDLFLAVMGQATLEDVVLARTTNPDSMVGHGIEIQSGSSVRASRLWIDGAREFGILMEGERTRLALSDSVVRNTLGRAFDSARGIGLVAQNSAEVEVRRTLFEGSREVGILASEDVLVDLEDVIIRDTLGQESDGEAGWGIGVQNGKANLRRVVLARNRAVSLLAVGERANIDMEDTVIRDTLSQAADGFGGIALQAQRGAAVQGERLYLKNSRQNGVVSVSTASVMLSDVAIDTVVRPSCAEEGGRCPSRASGIACSNNGRVTIEQGILEAAELCGAFAATDGELDATEVIFFRNRYGACFSDGSYDTSRIDSTFIDNDGRFEFTDVPPSPSEILTR